MSRSTVDGDSTCLQWGSNDGNSYGLIVSYESRIEFIGCSYGTSVACCGPAPAPVMASVPSILWFGRGLLVAFMLSAAGTVYLFRGRRALSSGREGPSLRG